MPEHLGTDEQKRLATRAIPALLLAGYDVNCTPDVFDDTAYRPAVHDARAREARPATQHPAPANSPSHPHRPAAPVRPPGRPGPLGAAHRNPIPGETCSSPHTPPISNRLQPRLATALFRRYLRACIPTGPDRITLLAGARPEAVLAETQRVGHRHHH
ncbi:hypothetical protein E4N62_12345 [Streptomyces sp. MNU76]|uniref:hypothetical protein n=1 Tax=Streptomyces sp. MNU76 TaxID=2560026 RepID=UPI001E284AC3|nr:hypothetical protein [Streptomyces sp. MNU76]MCC9705974.1 hypothetical protein [Streptomyces sp. MNU76]